MLHQKKSEVEIGSEADLVVDRQISTYRNSFFVEKRNFLNNEEATFSFTYIEEV